MKERGRWLGRKQSRYPDLAGGRRCQGHRGLRGRENATPWQNPGRDHGGRVPCWMQCKESVGVGEKSLVEWKAGSRLDINYG